MAALVLPEFCSFGLFVAELGRGYWGMLLFLLFQQVFVPNCVGGYAVADKVHAYEQGIIPAQIIFEAVNLTGGAGEKERSAGLQDFLALGKDVPNFALQVFGTSQFCQVLWFFHHDVVYAPHVVVHDGTGNHTTLVKDVLGQHTEDTAGGTFQPDGGIFGEGGIGREMLLFVLGMQTGANFFATSAFNTFAFIYFRI